MYLHIILGVKPFCMLLFILVLFDIEDVSVKRLIHWRNFILMHLERELAFYAYGVLML